MRPVEKTKKVKETYPWTLDEEMMETEKHLAAAEKVTGKKLSKEGVRNGGMDMIFTYDNQKKVFERNTPFGNNWWKPNRQP